MVFVTMASIGHVLPVPVIFEFASVSIVRLSVVELSRGHSRFAAEVIRRVSKSVVAALGTALTPAPAWRSRSDRLSH